MATLSITKPRKKRVWAITPAQTELLGRGARRLAKKFASQQIQGDVAECLRRLAVLQMLENACKLAQGDLLVELIDRHQFRAIDIAREMGRRPSDLSQLYHTAKLFPHSVRGQDIPYNHYFLAMMMSRKFRQLNLTPAQFLNEIRDQRLTQHREVTRHFAFRDQRRRLESKVLKWKWRVHEPALENMHHCRFQDLLGLIPNGAAKIIHCDPPYVYANNEMGIYRSRSLWSQTCDNNTREAAISTVVDLLAGWQPKLMPGGVLLLWQASNWPPVETVQAVKQYGWCHLGPIIWNKGRQAPGNFAAPYARQTEHLLVLYRASDELVNHDGSSRSEIMDFTPTSHPKLIGNQEHSFEKPLGVCQFLIRKHSDPGELVIDLCGCTGSMSVAAISTDRRWMYVESNAHNFGIGAAKILQRLAYQNKMS